MATGLIISDDDTFLAAQDDQIKTDLEATAGHTVTAVDQASMTLADFETAGVPDYDFYIVGTNTSSSTIASADGGNVIDFLDTTDKPVFVANKGSGVMPNMRMVLTSPTGTTFLTCDVPDTAYDGGNNADDVSYYTTSSGGGRINPTQLGLGAVNVANEINDPTRSIFFVYPLASTLADTVNTDQDGDAAPGVRAYWNAEAWDVRSTAARDLFLDSLTQALSESPASAPALTVQPFIYVDVGEVTEFGLSADVVVDSVSITKISGPDQNLGSPTTLEATLAGLNAGTTVFEITATKDGQTSAPQQVNAVVVGAASQGDVTQYVGSGTPVVGYANAEDALNDGTWENGGLAVASPSVHILALGTDRVDLFACHVRGADIATVTLDLFEGSQPPTSGGTPLESSGAITAPASDRGFYAMEPTASQGGATKWMRVSVA